MLFVCFAAEWLASLGTNKVLKQLQAVWDNLDNVLQKKKESEYHPPVLYILSKAWPLEL